jgi:hypothetical protein
MVDMKIDEVDDLVVLTNRRNVVEFKKNNKKIMENLVLICMF